MNKFNNMKHKVLYIHGYNSSLNSNTFRWLKEHLPNTDMYSINYNQSNPNDSIESLCNYVKEKHIDIAIGSGLGGWYTMRVASKCSLPCILINPLTDLTLKPTLEVVTKNNVNIVNTYIEYSKEHPLFQDNENWNGYSWDKNEDGDYAILLLSDSDELIKQTEESNKQFYNNFLNTIIITGAKHQLNDKEKEIYLLVYYNKLVNEIIPKMNYFYKNTNIIP